MCRKINVKNLALADVAVGVLSFAFQVALLAYCDCRCSATEKAATGIWGGIIFVVTGLYGFKFEFGEKMVMLCLTGISLACAIILVALSSTAANFWYSSGWAESATHVGLNIILIIGGILGIVINAILIFFGLKS